MRRYFLTILAAMFITLPALSGLDTVRKGRWVVVDDQGQQISQHDRQDKALASAASWALDNPGKQAEILPPRYVTAYTPDEPTEPPTDPDPVDPDPVDPPDPDPIDPPAEAGTITPGSGWTGPTLEPAQIGDRHERAIAHWNIVPEQTVADGFTVGVIAHHLDGVDRVEIAANGGEWVTITDPSINPRTKCEEYWATLRLDGQGAIELRAIVYPVNGQPTLVEPLGKTYREQDLTLYAGAFVGEVLELPAGEHNLSPRDMPDKGWLIVRPATGVDRKDCVLVGESKNWKKGRIKLENLTLRMPPGNNTMRGEYDRDEDGHYYGNHVWFDRCRLIGNGPAKSTSYPAVMWESQTYTDCEISDVQNATHSHGAIKMLIRNCYIHDIYEDTFRSSGLHVNVTIEDVDREPMVLAQGLEGNDRPHPDVWQFQNMPNTIAQDITAVKNINSQGLFPKDIKNTAIVRVEIESVNPYREFAIEGEAKNVLIAHSKFGGGQFRGEVPQGERMVLRQVVSGTEAPYLPTGWDKPGVEVQP